MCKQKKASFAWGLWHDPGLKVGQGCTKNKDKALEGYKKFIELAPNEFPDANWYGIQNVSEFTSLKYIQNRKLFVKVLEAAKQRVKDLTL